MDYTRSVWLIFLSATLDMEAEFLARNLISYIYLENHLSLEEKRGEAFEMEFFSFESCKNLLQRYEKLLFLIITWLLSKFLLFFDNFWCYCTAVTSFFGDDSGAEFNADWESWKLGSENQQKLSNWPLKFFKILKNHHKETCHSHNVEDISDLIDFFTHYLCSADLVLIC